MATNPLEQAVQYYRRREGEERLAAREAASDAGREAHDELADCYADNLKGLQHASSAP